MTRLKGPYDIAVQKQPDNTCGLISDLCAGHVEQEVGSNCGQLLQLYSVHKAIKEACRKGHLVTRNNKPTGEIKLIIQA